LFPDWFYVEVDCRFVFINVKSSAMLQIFFIISHWE